MESIFMCGCFRSNTSISAFILDNHLEILMANELCAFGLDDQQMNRRLRWCAEHRYHLMGMTRHKRFLRDMGENLSLDYESFYNTIVTHKEPINFTNFVNWVRKNKVGSVDWVGEKLPAFTKGKPIHEYSEILQKFRRFGPVKVICCVRDARDVIASQIRQWHTTPVKRRPLSRWKRPNLESCLIGPMTWYQYMASWTAWKKRAKVPWFELHYDKIVENRDGEATKLADFLGVDQQQMKVLFEKYFKPTAGWKESRPHLGKRMPAPWRKMLELYDFET